MGQIEPFDGEFPLPLLPGPLWLEVVASDRVLSMGQIEPFDL